jgi:tyrosinase
MAGDMVYRLPVADPATPAMAAFIGAMNQAQQLSDNRGYNYIAGFHGAPSWYCWHHQINPRTPLQARLFLPWHRAYLWWLEQDLQDRVPAVALPWWDWTTVARIPGAYAARRLADQSNPLYGTRASVPSAQPPINRRTRRAPGRNPQARLPLTTDLVTNDPRRPGVLEDTDWASFSDRLEDLHDHVHGWVGGDMGDVTTAAYDPIFFAHHCMIDRIWYLWQVRHGNGGVPRDLLDLELIPFGKRFRDVLDVQRLGYEYAASSTTIPTQAGGNG